MKSLLQNKKVKILFSVVIIMSSLPSIYKDLTFRISRYPFPLWSTNYRDFYIIRKPIMGVRYLGGKE